MVLAFSILDVQAAYMWLFAPTSLAPPPCVGKTAPLKKAHWQMVYDSKLKSDNPYPLN